MKIKTNSLYYFCYLTSLLFNDGVLRDDDEPLRLGGRSTFTLSLFVLPFSRMSPELLKT